MPPPSFLTRKLFFFWTAVACALVAPLGLEAAVRVEIEGIDDEPRDNARALLSIREADADELDEARVRQLHAKAPAEIEQALEPFGYYRPVIHSELERRGDDWVARYRVEPGPPLRLATVDLQLAGAGADDPRFQKLAADFPLRPGDVLLHPDWERGKQALVDHAAQNGYIDADFTAAEVRVDLDRYEARAILHFDTGPRYRFGRVTFHQDVLDPDVLYGYVKIERGAPLDVDQVLELQEALSDSPYFARVEVVTEPARAEGLEVPVEVYLREAFSLNWQREDFTVGLDDGISELVVPGASWERVEADDRIFPLDGYRLRLRLQGAHESLLSDATFLQAVAGGKMVRAVGDRMRAIGRLEAGSTWTSAFRSLPPSFRFFAGGDQSVRGYGFQELAPLDEAGNLIGGEALLTGSLEVDSLFFAHERFGRFGAAVFYDAGNALADFSDPLEQGAGLGLRWLSPIGLVRADAAWALTDEGRPVRFHLTIGPDL